MTHLLYGDVIEGRVYIYMNMNDIVLGVISDTDRRSESQKSLAFVQNTKGIKWGT